MAVDVEKCIVVSIAWVCVFFLYELLNLLIFIAACLLILFIEFGCLSLIDRLIFSIDIAAPWHPTIAAITSKIELAVQLVHFVTLVAMHHTCKTKSMRINRAGKQFVLFSLAQTFWDLDSFYFGLLLITRLACKDLLIDIAISVSTVFLNIF